MSLTPSQAAATLAIKRARALERSALRTLFLDARTPNGFLDEAVPHDLLVRMVDLAELGPTRANQLPMRLVLVQTPEAKERLRPALAADNVEKTMQAPIVAVVGASIDPKAPAAGHGALDSESTITNTILQGGYLIFAARSLGLDAGPISGFSRELVDREFFPDGTVALLFLLNIGYGDDAKLLPRRPRPAFADVVTVV